MTKSFIADLDWIRSIVEVPNRSIYFLVRERFRRYFRCQLLDREVHLAAQQCLLQEVYLYAKHHRLCQVIFLLIEPLKCKQNVNKFFLIFLKITKKSGTYQTRLKTFQSISTPRRILTEF